MVNVDKETGKVKKAMTTDQFKAVIDVNLVGAFITLREAAIRMVNNKYDGLLVPISSVNKSGQTGQMNYCSAKAALALWPHIIVGELQMRGVQHVRCVAIAPGYVGTPMVKGMNQEALAGSFRRAHQPAHRAGRDRQRHSVRGGERRHRRHLSRDHRAASSPTGSPSSSL